MKGILIACGLAFCLVSGSVAAVAQQASRSSNGGKSQVRENGDREQERLIKEVHDELVLLPYYGVFDNLAYRVDKDGTVTLLGQVSRPTLKSDAESAVKHIEGAEGVVNQIEVLPLSPNDDRIRRDTYRAVYGQEVLNQYALRAVPPIHIVVNNGHVTLEGAVANQMDKNVAGRQANGVSGVFSVTNNLVVDAN